MHSKYSVASITDTGIVCGDDHGASGVAHLAKDIDDDRAVVVIESTRRLVREH
ncbi:hypothetical protein [Streptomyces sp. NPDC000133]|uniref:hypothetical protein n=1 Tax=Streptomyces sp. NPDC000133 TaxID=3364535 RepID=UPI00369BFEEE